ncbi:cupin [Zafaria sp. Z1313]|uniref:cupin n=1 Tax=unclassified Zafaria TaxID=2828765 RepID=UPI002E7992B3|nr:cupin [Zafaria sp. J156]MEE1620267.1 cupin [Zafaria sp. J156]
MHVTRAELDALAEEHLAKAASAPHRRSARVVLNDGRLRHTLIALAAGAELGDHSKPEAATLLVLRGAVRVGWDSGEVRVSHGGLFVLPDAVHRVGADEPSVFLLTTLAG